MIPVQDAPRTVKSSLHIQSCRFVSYKPLSYWLTKALQLSCLTTPALFENQIIYIDQKKNRSFLCSILLYFSKMKRNTYTTNHIPALSTYSSNITHAFQEIPCGNIRSSLIIQEFAWKKQSEQPNKPSLLTNDSTLKLYANN